MYKKIAKAKAEIAIGRTHFTSTEPVVVRQGKVVLKTAHGPFHIDTNEPLTVQFDTEGTMFVKPRAVMQTQRKSSSEIFTTLDRPSPLSPEAEAVARAARKNEIEREAMRAEMERRYEEILNAVAESTAKKEVRPKSEGNTSDAEDSKRETEDAKADVSRKSKATDRPSSQKSAKKDAEVGNTSAGVD